MKRIFWQEKLSNANELKFQMLKHSYATLKSHINEKKLIDYMENENTRWNFGRTYTINLENYFNAYKVKDLTKQINFFVKSFTYVKAYATRVNSFWYINDLNELVITIIERVKLDDCWSLKVTYFTTCDCLRTFFKRFFEKVIIVLKRKQIKQNLGYKKMLKHTLKRDILYRKYEICKAKLEILKKQREEKRDSLVCNQISNLFGGDVMYSNDL